MQNAALIGLSRQVALERELQVVANNVANMSTTGFKADNSIFEDYLMPTARANNFQPGDRRLNFVQDRGTWHDFGQGPVEQTGNPLDVAIDGDAFLVVQTPNGERYTRNGALKLNSAGELVTSEGYQVLGENGPIVFQQLDREVVISPDGRITVQEGPSALTDTQRGKLRLATFPQAQQLQKDGSSMFAAPAGVVPDAAPTTVRVIQGVVEKSNVKPVVEMTRLIEITRTYTQIAGMLQQNSDLRRNAIQQLADVPS
ncbi:MAG TPA: flagellar basal-body rod protein FlgF [Xanthobacteraceae bacterium]|jgi:flagellar basal-body rod protein FlgF/flagellar basal-body rod protein FlgG|nr:flagellar basal-body rod protein FlgF [Xanthobacteraceae bacterium]